MKLQKIVFLVLFMIVGLTSVSQNMPNNKDNSTSIYTVFDTFFEDEIKKQGVKGNWIFKLNEVTGFHKFDFNNDDFNDILMEFSAVQEVGEGMTLYFTVLFKNFENKNYTLVNFLDSREIRFSRFEENSFYFNSSLNKKDKIVFKLVNSKFIKQ